jgi:1-aminocyclopropane-1-carboxylate deaminase
MKNRFKGILIMLLSIFTTAKSQPLLFDAYPALKDTIPYIALGNLESTPIIEAKTIGKAYGTNLYIKCDGTYGTDNTGNNIFSGNKRRKLEFLLADAVAHDAKHVYAQGGAGSNFATCTAAYAHELGLGCTLVLGPQRNTLYVQRNLKLDLFYGADIVACHSRESRARTCKELAYTNTDGYYIPLGGSNKIGALGYVNAAFELKNQIEHNNIPQPDVIYITVSSAGMAAGLVVGLHAANLNIPVRLVRIDGTPQSITQELTQLIKETSEYLKQCDKTFPILNTYEETFTIINDMTGHEYVETDHAIIKRHSDMNFDTYALITPEAAAAIKTLYQETGIKLDGTYAGKTFAACLRDINAGQLKNKSVLFWSSFCSGDLIEYTNMVDTTKLPLELQKYINEEYPLQDLDQGI